MRINELNRHVGRPFEGVYRCGRIGKPNLPVGLAFRINDATGVCTAKFPAERVNDLVLEPGMILSLKGTATLDSSGNVQVRVEDCAPTQACVEPSWHLTPRAWVPDRALPAFDRLLRLLDRMDADPVRAFLDKLFADLSVARPYLRAPASRDHHHAGLGGLLIHSVECAEAAEELAQRFLPSEERSLGILGALMHDISKTRMFVEQGSDQHAIYGVTQEALSLEVLAPYLADLDTQWPNGAVALREMLAPSRHSGSFNGWTPLLLTDFIRYIDRLSAGADLRATRFGQLPANKRCTRTRQGQLLARVLPPAPNANACDLGGLL